MPASIAAIREDGSLLSQSAVSIPLQYLAIQRSEDDRTFASKQDVYAQEKTGTSATLATKPASEITVSPQAGIRLDPQSLAVGLKKMRLIYEKCPKCLFET